MIDSDENTNYDLFKDCLSGPIITQCSLPAPSSKRRRSGKSGQKSSGALDSIEDVNPCVKQETDAAELAEFIDVSPFPEPHLSLTNPTQYLATEIFTALPASLRQLNYTTFTSNSALQTAYA